QLVGGESNKTLLGGFPCLLVLVGSWISFGCRLRLGFSGIALRLIILGCWLFCVRLALRRNSRLIRRVLVIRRFLWGRLGLRLFRSQSSDFLRIDARSSNGDRLLRCLR